MPNVLLPILPGTLPTGYCFESWQQTLNDFADNMQALLAGGQSFYNKGPDLPLPEYQEYPWFRTTDGRWYFYDGQWISPNPEQSTDVIRMWKGTLVELQSYDGGDTDPPSDRSGPMWEEYTGLQGRSPMGPGTVPDVDPAKVLSVEEDYGSGMVSLTEKQIAPHMHTIRGRRSISGNTDLTDLPLIDDDYLTTPVTEAETEPAGGEDPDTDTEGAPHMNVHPVRGIYFIQRTNRTYYVAT